MSMKSILIVDDAGTLLVRDYNEKFNEKEYQFELETNFDTQAIIHRLENRENSIGVVLLDIYKDGEQTGFSVLERIKERFGEQVQVLMLTVANSLELAIAAGRKGAYGYIVKDKETDKYILQKLDCAWDIAMSQRKYAEVKENEPDRLGDFIGKCQAIREVYDLIEIIAPTDISVLLQGETGTGKTLLAWEIHKKSCRSKSIFKDENIAAIPKTGNLMEATLFGRIQDFPNKGDLEREGIFEAANGGTVFLDEIGAAVPETQIALLKVIEEKKVKKLGSKDAKDVDFRLISGTNINLRNAIKEKQFREDLYYRISGIEVYLPSLRERKEDITLLITYFLDKSNQKYNRALRLPDDRDLTLLRKYEWPGNIRELERVIERCFVLTPRERDVLCIPEMVRRQLTEQEIN